MYAEVKEMLEKFDGKAEKLLKRWHEKNKKFDDDEDENADASNALQSIFSNMGKQIVQDEEL